MSNESGLHYISRLLSTVTRLLQCLLLSLETVGVDSQKLPLHRLIFFGTYSLTYIPSLETSDTFTAYLSRLIILGTMILGLLVLSAARGGSDQISTGIYFRNMYSRSVQYHQNKILKLHNMP